MVASIYIPTNNVGGKETSSWIYSQEGKFPVLETVNVCSHLEGFDESAAAAAKSLQSCLTLCNPIDGSPPGSAIPGILQARILEWVAISSSNAWKWKVKVKSLSRVRLLATPWTAAYQAPPSMGFSRQEYWSGVPLLSPSDESSSQIKSCFTLIYYFLNLYDYISPLIRQ